MRKSHYQNEEPPKSYGGNAFGIHALSFFRKVAIVSDVDVEFVIYPRRSGRENMFAEIKFSFTNNKWL